MSLKTNSDYLFSHQVERALWHSAGLEKNTDVIVMSLWFNLSIYALVFVFALNPAVAEFIEWS